MPWKRNRVLKPEAPEGAFHLADIGTAEQAHVHEQGIEVVEVAALLEEPRGQGPELPVAAEESIAEGVE
jgi:hypothetical protein